MRSIFLFIVLVSSLLAEQLRFATLNSYLCFKPGVEVNGRLHGPASLPIYNEKISNLARLIGDAQIVAIEEIGSKIEASDISAALSPGTVVQYVQGKDTYTGENVAILLRLPPGYKVDSAQRVSSLSAKISKHVLSKITCPDGRKIYVLAVHLIVAGRNEAKNEMQRRAIQEWASQVIDSQSASAVIVLGDFNLNAFKLVLAGGRDCLELINYPSTHSSNLCLDRIILFPALGTATWQNTRVVAPPYGPRPNATNKILWSDHFAVHSTLNY